MKDHWHHKLGLGNKWETGCCFADFQFCTNYRTIAGKQNKTKLNLIKHLHFFIPLWDAHGQSLHRNVQYPMQIREKCFPGVDNAEVFPSGPANYKKVPMSQVDSGWLRGAMARFCTALMSCMAYGGCNGSTAQLHGLKFLITGVKSWPLVMRWQWQKRENS